MKSPLLQEIPAPKYRIVEGRHLTRERGTVMNLTGKSSEWVELTMNSQIAYAADLRELAELFTALADALDGGATA